MIKKKASHDCFYARLIFIKQLMAMITDYIHVLHTHNLCKLIMLLNENFTKKFSYLIKRRHHTSTPTNLIALLYFVWACLGHLMLGFREQISISYIYLHPSTFYPSIYSTFPFYLEIWLCGVLDTQSDRWFSLRALY